MEYSIVETVSVSMTVGPETVEYKVCVAYEVTVEGCWLGPTGGEAVQVSTVEIAVFVTV